MKYAVRRDKKGQAYLEVGLTDFALISQPFLNKGMAFSEKERKAFKLFGLVPPSVTGLHEQRERSYEAFNSKATALEKYIYLRDLQDSNETLFYSLLTHHLTEMLPIVYTPTVGMGCQKMSHVYRRQRGVFLAYPYQDYLDEILANPRFDAVEVIVVSDGERILGLGDLGAGGMGIPIGKLALYTACAGIHPDATLPILLDTGTNNAALLKDPLYIGWRHERIRGADYEAFIKKFVEAVQKRFPHVVLQWEDIGQEHANFILEKYRHQLCTFNDDIQGTAAVVVGSLLAAMQVAGHHLQDQQIVVMGAGAAGCGISHLLFQALLDLGLSEKEARARFYLIDRQGLLVEGMKGLQSFQASFVQPKAKLAGWTLEGEEPNFIGLKDVLNNINATVLVGVSGQPGIFTEELVRLMAAKVKRPVIFPLSNPTERSEARPKDLMLWTEGRVLMGTGSPFPLVIKNGQPFHVDQTNNAYIFPGMGLGLSAVKASRVNEQMFMLAAKVLAKLSPARIKKEGNLLPPLSDIREVSIQIALAVAKEAIRAGLTEASLQHYSQTDLEQLIREKVWEPVYLPYRPMN